jgi:hypothetical protein
MHMHVVNARCTPTSQHAKKLECIIRASNLNMDMVLTAPVVAVFGMRRFVTRSLLDQRLHAAELPPNMCQGVGLHVQFTIVSHHDSMCMRGQVMGTVRGELSLGRSRLHKMRPINLVQTWDVLGCRRLSTVDAP